VSDRTGLKSWLGYRPENQDGASGAPDLTGRIHELESEIATLRAKPELADLSEAEVEMMASETAVTILKAAHAREALAAETGARILAQANSDAAALTTAAQKQSFETINSAEKNAASIVDKAMQDAETLVRNATNEANALRAAAQEEVRKYKSWLVANVKETLKLQASQEQALASATKNIEAWQANVNGAVALLSAHQQSLETELVKGDSLGQ
jgi:vacuolar-type H+-ATPase subunit H